MMGVGLIALLLPTVSAQSVDSKVERLERLERALKIEDCAYAVEELEHLNISYSSMPFKYALLAEGYLCIGKPAKSKLAVQEFARLGGEANQLSMRVQEYCALQECALSPVLVKPVEQETTAVTEVESNPTVVEIKEEVEKEEVEEVRIEPADQPVVSPSLDTDVVVEVDVDIVKPVERLLQPSEPEIPVEVVSDPIMEELSTVETEDGGQGQDDANEAMNEAMEVQIEPAAEEPVSETIETEMVEVPAASEGATIFTVEEINGMVVDGQCADAAVAGANLVAVEPENALGHMAFGDALACYPEGSGDIFAAFDAWMLAKSLAKTQQLDWNPMKERLGWALERSGIVKIVPEFEEGYTDWPEGFSIELEAAVSVNLSPRTDHMLGGTYLTNLPEGEATLRITPGGARPDVVTTLTIAAGELQKIRVPIGPEKHVRLPNLPAPEGYLVTFSNAEGETVEYRPQEGLLLLKDTYTATATYGEQTYDVNVDLEALSTAENPASAFRDLLPWVYQVRNGEGTLLTEGLVNPEMDVQEVRLDLAKESYFSWRDGMDPEAETDAVQLVASGTLMEMEESLFTEIVIDPSLHPFYEGAEELYALEQDLLATTNSTQWLTGTMLTAGVWTGVSLALANGENENAGFWESQAIAGSMLTLPMVAIWMNEKLRVEPSQQRMGSDVYDSLLSMDGEPVAFDALIPLPEGLSEADVEDDEQLVEEIEEEEVDPQDAESVQDTDESEQEAGDSSQ